MIHAGDLFDVLPTLPAASIDACVTDPPYGIESGGVTLQLCLDQAVATTAEGQQVVECVRGEVIASEQAVRPDMVNVTTWTVALLTGVAVALSRLALLRLPVWSTVSAVAVDELRVSGADPVGVAARPGAVLALTAWSDVAWTSREAAPATDADPSDLSSEFGGDGGVLAPWRTRFAAPVLQPGRRYRERLSACLAAHRNHGSILQGTR